MAKWRDRTFAGVKLRWGLTKDGKSEWRARIAGEPWVLFRKADRIWQGYTEDHWTGMQASSLTRLIVQVERMAPEWQEKLRVRRKAGTRMVDPKRPAA